MEEIPVAAIKRGKIRREGKVWKRKERVELVRELIEKYGMVYVIDMDGVPNFRFYKAIGKKIWVDISPRDLNDIFDLLVCGVEKITIRSLDEKYLEEIYNVVESEIFIFDDIEKAKKYKLAGVVTEKDIDIEENLQIWKICMDSELIRRIR